MTGIVERLRACRPRDDSGDPVRHTICDEAADHIEKLKARVRELEAKQASVDLERRADDFMFGQLVGGQTKPRSYRAIFRRALKGRFS